MKPRGKWDLHVGLQKPTAETMQCAKCKHVHSCLIQLKSTDYDGIKLHPFSYNAKEAVATHTRSGRGKEKCLVSLVCTCT